MTRWPKAGLPPTSVEDEQEMDIDVNQMDEAVSRLNVGAIMDGGDSSNSGPDAPEASASSPSDMDSFDDVAAMHHSKTSKKDEKHDEYSGSEDGEDRESSPVRPDQFQVEKILNMRKSKEENQDEYLIKWFGFPNSENSWELAENVHCHELIHEFHETRSNSKSSGRKRKSTDPEEGDLDYHLPAKIVEKSRKSDPPRESVKKKPSVTKERGSSASRGGGKIGRPKGSGRPRGSMKEDSAAVRDLLASEESETKKKRPKTHFSAAEKQRSSREVRGLIGENGRRSLRTAPPSDAGSARSTGTDVSNKAPETLVAASDTKEGQIDVLRIFLSGMPAADGNGGGGSGQVVSEAAESGKPVVVGSATEVVSVSAPTAFAPPPPAAVNSAWRPRHGVAPMPYRALQNTRTHDIRIFSLRDGKCARTLNWKYSEAELPETSKMLKFSDERVLFPEERVNVLARLETGPVEWSQFICIQPDPRDVLWGLPNSVMMQHYPKTFEAIVNFGIAVAYQGVGQPKKEESPEIT